MVCMLLREIEGEPNQNVALVEIGQQEGGITLFRRGIWSMERRFLTSSPLSLLASETEAAEPVPMDQEKLLLEIGRTLQYFKQQFRNENIGQIILYGSAVHTEAMCTLLASSFNVPVEPLAIGAREFDLSPIPEETHSGLLSLYNMACIAALHHRFEKYIDFMPPESREVHGESTRRYLVAALALLLYAILGGVWMLVAHEAARLSSPSMALPRPAATASIPIDRAEQLLTERTFVLSAIKAEEWLKGKHRVLAQLVRELAETIPAQMTVTGLQVEEKPNAWQVTLKCEISSPNGSRSQELFSGFQARAKNTASLKHLAFGEIEIVDQDAGNTSSNLAHKNQLTFNLNGLIQYPDTDLAL
jgi:hypothetical protein